MPAILNYTKEQNYSITDTVNIEADSINKHIEL